MLISIIVPTLNEAACIEATIAALHKIRGESEVIIVDGGSSDGTPEIAGRAGAKVVTGAKGRGPQMHAGAEASGGDVLWFVHADTIPPVDAIEHITHALRVESAVAGTFSLTFAGASRAARQMTWIYPRLRWLGLSYGDASIFVRRSAYGAIGGFKAYALFEDLDLIRRLKRVGRFVRIEARIVTSARRFESNYIRTWAIWITLQVLYWAGVSPHRLARWYRHVR